MIGKTNKRTPRHPNRDYNFIYRYSSLHDLFLISVYVFILCFLSTIYYCIIVLFKKIYLRVLKWSIVFKKGFESLPPTKIV